MKLRLLLSIAVSFSLISPAALGGTRPHYGGILRVQSRDFVTSIDNVWVSPQTVLQQQLSELLFDRLTAVDDAGVARPSLAASWRSDQQQRIWEFQIRTGASFSDGSIVSTQDVAACIAKAAPQWKVTTNAQSVIVEADSATPHLPELLALPEFSITKLDVDKNVMGSGPFRIDVFQAARRIALIANDDYWAGRPYLDRIEITMGGSVREELINRRLDQDDVAELTLDQARTIGYGAQNNPSSLPAQRMAVPRPGDLYALLFVHNVPAVSTGSRATTPADDPRIREAIALTIDRSSISRVLLQKQAEAAPALLPQWMTGYEFLFDSQPDAEQARRLRNDAFRATPVSIPLAYDSGDNVARAIADRLAVNAREANITLQTFGEKNLTLDSAANTSAQVMLLRLPLASTSPIAALSDLEMRTGFAAPVVAQTESGSSTEGNLAAERAALASFRIIPVAHVPQIYWLNPRVRDWTTPPTGGWRLQDVWVEGDRPSSSPVAILR